MHVYDAVSVDIECHLDLRNASWRRWNTIEYKTTQGTIVLSKLTLTLQHIDLDTWLAIASSREDLALLGWDGGVALNQTCRDSTQGLDTQ